MTTEETTTTNNATPAGEGAADTGLTDAQAAENLWPDADGGDNDSLSGSDAGGDPKPSADESGDPKPEGEEGKKPDGETDPKEKEGDGDGDGEDPADDKGTEYSDFTIPEELPAQEADVNWIKDFGKEHKIPQEAVQGLIDKHVEMTNRSFDEFNEMKNEWKAEFEADPELGQANFKKTCDTANAVVSKYFEDDFTDKLIMFGIGNDKHFAKGLLGIDTDLKAKDSEIADLKAKIEKLTGEEGLDGSLGAGQETKKDPASIMYPDMN